MPDLTQSAAWAALDAHFATIKDVTMKDMFSDDPDRFKKFSMEYEDILFDYSKNRISEETMKLLYGLAEQQDVLGLAKKMYSGEKISKFSRKLLVTMNIFIVSMSVFGSSIRQFFLKLFRFEWYPQRIWNRRAICLFFEIM
jgi:hypothetical protein